MEQLKNSSFAEISQLRSYHCRRSHVFDRKLVVTSILRCWDGKRRALPCDMSSCWISSSTASSSYSFMTLNICSEEEEEKKNMPPFIMKKKRFYWKGDVQSEGTSTWCLRENTATVTQTWKWVEKPGYREGHRQRGRDRPLPCRAAPTARAACGPLTAGRSTPPPSPPGR